MQPPKYATTNGHAVFDLQTEQLREFEGEFLSSFNLSWSFALRKPTWRDILRHQYMNGTVRNQDLLESTLNSMSTLCQKLSSGLTRECSITLPSVKGTDDIEHNFLVRIHSIGKDTPQAMLWLVDDTDKQDATSLKTYYIIAGEQL